jgi:hypothetical protein
MLSPFKKSALNQIRVLATLAVGLAALAVFTLAVNAYSTSPYKWAVSPVLVYVNPANQDVTAAAAEAAIQVALNTWSTQSGSAFRYQYGGRVSDKSSTFDGRNVVIFRNATNGGAIGSTYSWWSGGARIDSDVIFWDAAWKFFSGTSGCADGAYIEDIATHELGHMLGLSHSSLTDATMYSRYNRCSTSMRTLASDDIAGLKALYPGSGGSTNTAPTVTITSPVNGTSVVEGTSINFNGSATDTQDGTLTASLVWTSSLDGRIGTGGRFSRTLSAGSHAITAKVVDSAGLSASKQVGVTVTTKVISPPPSNNVALASNGAVVRASSVYSAGYPPEGAINGDRKGTGWESGGGWNDGTQNIFPDWIEVQFNGTKTIGRIDIFTVQDEYKSPVEPTSAMTFTKYGLIAFHLEFWTGAAWAPISGGSVTGNHLVWRTFTFAPVSTSKIRVVVNAALNSWSRVTEIEAYADSALAPPPPSGVNVALASKGAVVKASSVYSAGYDPAGAVNGDRKGTRWGSGGGWNDATQNTFPDWIEVQFKGTQTIGRIDVFSVQDAYTSPAEPTSTMTFTKYGLTAFRLEFWTGAAWAPISGGTVSGNNLVWRTFTFVPVATSKIRVVVNAALNSWSRITEIEAYTP